MMIVTEDTDMSMGHRKDEEQGQMFIAISDLPSTAGHPFYEKLNEALRVIGFDAKVEAACQKFYHESVGRKGIAPGVYFRMLLIGYFEGIDSERGIALDHGVEAFVGICVNPRRSNVSGLPLPRSRRFDWANRPIHFHCDGSWVIPWVMRRRIIPRCRGFAGVWTRTPTPWCSR